MRRPIRVKSFSLSLRGFFLFPLSQAALSPPFHPHSWLSDFRSVPVGCSRFIRCCHLVSGLCFPLYEGSWARHLSQSPKLGGRAQLFGANSFTLPGFSMPLRSSLSDYCAAVRKPRHLPTADAAVPPASVLPPPLAFFPPRAESFN